MPADAGADTIPAAEIGLACLYCLQKGRVCIITVPKGATWYQPHACEECKRAKIASHWCPIACAAIVTRLKAGEVFKAPENPDWFDDGHYVDSIYVKQKAIQAKGTSNFIRIREIQTDKKKVNVEAAVTKADNRAKTLALNANKTTLAEIADGVKSPRVKVALAALLGFGLATRPPPNTKTVADFLKDGDGVDINEVDVELSLVTLGG